MLNFNLSQPTNIFFGKNQITELGKNLNALNVAKVLVLYGGGSIKKNGVYDDAINELKKANISYVELAGVEPNPRYSTVLKGVALCKAENIDLVLALGGGSVVDCAKAIALARFYEGADFWMDMIKTGKASTLTKALPIAVVLTLAATGSETNSYSVISNMDTKEKLGFASVFVKPKITILDPQYTFSVPKNQISAGVVDAFSHCLEQLFSPQQSALITDNLIIGTLKTLVSVGRKAMDEPNDYDSHANLMWAASVSLNHLFSMGKTGDWSSHTIEHAVSAHYDITHAVGLAIIFPAWLKHILSVETLHRFELLGQVFNISFASAKNDAEKIELAKKVIDSVSKFFVSLEMPTTLSQVGVKKESIDAMVVSTFAYGNESIGSIKKLSKVDVKNILLSIA